MVDTLFMYKNNDIGYTHITYFGLINTARQHYDDISRDAYSDDPIITRIRDKLYEDLSKVPPTKELLNLNPSAYIMLAYYPDPQIQRKLALLNYRMYRDTVDPVSLMHMGACLGVLKETIDQIEYMVIEHLLEHDFFYLYKSITSHDVEILAQSFHHIQSYGIDLKTITSCPTLDDFINKILKIGDKAKTDLIISEISDGYYQVLDYHKQCLQDFLSGTRLSLDLGV